MLKEFEIAGYDMPCVDLAVNVDVFPKPNGGTGINAMSWQGGGKVATGMVAAARLGAKCAMIGAVGSDDYGEFCLRDFERHGIDISGMKTRQGETTSLSIVLSDRETQGRSIVYRSGTANPPYVGGDRGTNSDGVSVVFYPLMPHMWQWNQPSGQRKREPKSSWTPIPTHRK